ncbi:MAG: YebC/PmpR family DNA-binding transcriptional regulator [Candidatus Zixiibacteriota bacterium]|nr:MAG: YebC/PmpR family DNA-binding transcriptional regulator [candidate division Zixibacteria bacterium]HDL04430.1 YebC/PmpR family DNA-binding transcriptional regulator [candidate division Zixibacteria bacterium]
MSGHSKWATIKRKKGKADAERGRMFTRLIKEITVAARQGGGDPDANPRLRTAVGTAKAANMPADNIKRAIQKGTGELPGVSYDEVTYEGYGPNGVAVYVECLTDNKKRTVAEIRHLFSRYNGNLGENGCVAWMFDKKGIINVETSVADEDTLLEIALEAGAADFSNQGDVYEIVTPPADLEQIRAALEEKSIPVVSARATMIPQNTIKLEDKPAETMIKLYEALEDHDDVQNVYANFDIDDSVLEKLAG